MECLHVGIVAIGSLLMLAVTYIVLLKVSRDYRKYREHHKNTEARPT